MKDCVTMVNEVSFKDNSSQWEAWRKDKTTYNTWLQQKIEKKEDRSHGFRFRGQYQKQVPALLDSASGND